MIGMPLVSKKLLYLPRNTGIRLIYMMIIRDVLVRTCFLTIVMKTLRQGQVTNL